MSSQKKKKSLFKILLPICITAAALGIIINHDPSLLGWQIAWPKVLRPLFRMLLFLAVGLVAGLVIETMGWAPLLARLVRPMMRFGKLQNESGAAFTTAFLSGTAANSMLMSFWRDGKLTKQEMQLSYLVNTGLPVFLLHLPTTFFIIVPITGNAGIIYLTLNGIAALLRTLFVLGWTRISLHKSQNKIHRSEGAKNSNAQQTSSGLSLKRVGSLFKRRFTRIITITAPIYFLMFALTQAGLFETMRQFTAKWISTGILPVEAASIVIFAVASEFTSGIAAAGALLDAGTLTTQQTVLALVLGTIAATPIRAVRHQLPSHAGIFTPALGFVMLLQSQALRISSLGLVTALWYCLC